MRVFVVGTGRCGTTTFARACEHFTNYRVGHETNRARPFPYVQLDYFPDQWIEVDNRLSFFLPYLKSRYPDALFFHLKRDRRAVVASFLAREGSQAIEGFARMMFQSPRHRQHTVEAYVDMVNSLCADYCDKIIAIEGLHLTFNIFAQDIGARGDIEAAIEETRIRHNAA